MNENEAQQFMQRKRDHIRLSLLDEVQATEASDLHRFELIHDSLPDLNLSDVSIESTFLDQPVATPFFVAGMTAGHDDADAVNSCLAEIASERGWVLGLGSQRRELNGYEDLAARKLSARFPNLKLIGNFGITQLIELHRANRFSVISKLVEEAQLKMVAVHLNPLQEALQVEGTPDFKDCLTAIEAFIKASPVPVILKETGSGLSTQTLEKIKKLNPYAVDVSGLGGTHWGRIEGKRAPEQSVNARMGETFKNWGTSTAQSVLDAQRILTTSTEIWASGGVKNGVDAAKLFALGANRVGFAKLALVEALKGANALNQWMETIENELKVALFCTNSPAVADLSSQKLRMKEYYGPV